VILSTLVVLFFPQNNKTFFEKMLSTQNADCSKDKIFFHCLDPCLPDIFFFRYL